jgi:hypothetical protein
MPLYIYIMECYACKKKLNDKIRFANVYTLGDEHLYAHWSCVKDDIAKDPIETNISGVYRAKESIAWEDLTAGQKGSAKRLVAE